MVKNRVGPVKGSQRSKDPFFSSKKSSYQSPSADNTPFFIQSSSKSDGESSRNLENKNDGFFVKNKSKDNTFKDKQNANTNSFKPTDNKFSKNNSFEQRNQKNKYERNDHNIKNKNGQERNHENRGFFNKINSKSDRKETEVGTKFKSGKVEKRNADRADKKPFDKRKWRLQKYSKKYKLEQWEDKRKKAVLRGYYKEIKDDKPKMDVQKIYSQYADEDSDNENENKESTSSQTHKYVRNPNYVPRETDLEDIEFTEEVDEPTKELEVASSDKKGNKFKGKGNAFNKARIEFERIKQEKVAKKEEYLKKKAEREEALKEYKRKKNEKYKKLNKKTKRGQPVMKDRLEMLLEKIQAS